MANRRFTSQFNYSFHAMPVLIDCKFVVDNTAGAGVTGLKGPGVSQVFMFSSAPVAANHVAAGYIRVQLQDPYYKFYSLIWSSSPPVTGAAINVTAGLTLGLPYQIQSVGTTSTAAWVALGVPVGITPAVGVSFFAATASVGSGTGTVKAFGITNTQSIQALPSTELSLGTVGTSANGGGYINLQCLAATNAGTTTMIPTAPTAGSLIRLAFWLSNSSVVLQGE